MKCDELLPNYLLYAMGRMEEPELSELRAHLARGCQDCTAGVRVARAFADSMGTELGAGQDPSPALRDRVLAMAQKDRDARSLRVMPASVERPDLALVAKQRRPFWLRPMPVWLGSAIAAACLVLALIPGVIWRRELFNAEAERSRTAAMLASEQASSAAAQDRLSKLTSAPSRSSAVPIFALELVRGGPEDVGQKLTIPRGASAVVLALPSELVQQATAAELRNASDQTIWTASPLVGGSSESVGLTIPVELLSNGRYSIALRAGERTIARLRFNVTR